MERGRGGEGRERASGGRGLHVAYDLRLHLSPVAWTTLPHCSASPLLLFAPALAACFPPIKLLLHWRELGPLRSPSAAPAGGRGSWAPAVELGGPHRAPASPRLQLQGSRAAALHRPIIAAASEFGRRRSVLSPITTAAAAALEFGCCCPTSL